MAPCISKIIEDKWLCLITYQYNSLSCSGEAVQHLQYLPLRQAQGSAFGESFVSQTSTSWQTRYSFSGKEKDAETGYSYFGARYYDSDLSIWLSVDPMSDKYPNQSAYSYVGGRPINVIDPNGLWEQDAAGNWVAQKGDGYWKLHKQAGISLADAKAAVIAANKERGQKRSSETMVYEKDVINLSGGNQEGETTSGGSTSANISETSSTSANSTTSEAAFTPPPLASGRCDYSPVNVESLLGIGVAVKAILRLILTESIPANNSSKPTPKFQTPKYPAQNPPENIKSGFELFVGRPTKQYPNGYWKIEKPLENGGLQGVDPLSYKPVPKHEYHVPLPRSYRGPFSN
jgi:RHS repeat-associated protein